MNSHGTDVFPLSFGHHRSFIALHGKLKCFLLIHSENSFLLLSNFCFLFVFMLAIFLSQCNVFVLSCACVVLNMSVSLFLNLYSRVISVKDLCKWECFLLFSLSRLVCQSISVTFFLSPEILFLNKCAPLLHAFSLTLSLYLSISVLSSFSRDVIFEQVFFLFFHLSLIHSFNFPKPG